MRKRIICSLGVCLLMTGMAFAQTKTNMAWISGILRHFGNQDEVLDFSEFEYLLPPRTDHVVIPGAAGEFNVTFRVEAPNYFRLGRNSLYLSPGDDLQVVIDFEDPMQSSFMGDGSAANNFLRGIAFSHGGSFINGGFGLRPTAQATVDVIEEAVAGRKKMLDTLTGVSREFKRLEYARIRADAINSYAMADIYYRFQTKDKDSLAAFKATFDSIAAPLVIAYRRNFVDASLMKLDVYRDIVKDLIQQGGPEHDIQVIKDWFSASDLVEKMNQVNDKAALAAFRGQITVLGTPAYKNAMDKTLDELLKFGRGDEAVDFTGVDMEGKPERLSSLKGKLIYVDIWATWCGPCMAEMPHFEALKAKFKDNPAIAFVSLSVDSDKGVWQKSVRDRQASGFQWQIDWSKLNAYNIVGIPRTLLINKNFKIIDLNGGLPSSPETAAEILRYL